MVRKEIYSSKLHINRNILIKIIKKDNVRYNFAKVIYFDPSLISTDSLVDFHNLTLELLCTILYTDLCSYILFLSAE